MILILVLTSILFSGVYISTNRMPELFPFGSEIMEFFYVLSVSTISAAIFYLFQVYIPSRKRHKIIKNNFEKTYISFKERCISIFISSVNGTYTVKEVEALLDLTAFRDYFKEEIEPGLKRWDEVANSLDDRTITQLLIEIELLKEETDFFLNNVILYDQEIFGFLKRLKNTYYEMKSIDMDYEDYKTLLKFFWEVFAGWSFVTGYRDKDIFKEMLKKVKY